MGDGCVVIYACGEKKGLSGEGGGGGGLNSHLSIIDNLISMNQYYLRIRLF